MAADRRLAARERAKLEREALLQVRVMLRRLMALISQGVVL